MENRNTGNANDANNPNEEWISNENRDQQVQGATEEQVESLSASEQKYDSNESQTRYASDDRDDDDKKDDNDDNEGDTDEGDADDWGTVDPLDAPGSLPDPMDPSGPGSAV